MVAPVVGAAAALDHHGDHRRDLVAGDQRVELALQAEFEKGRGGLFVAVQQVQHGIALRRARRSRAAGTRGRSRCQRARAERIAGGVDRAAGAIMAGGDERRQRRRSADGAARRPRATRARQRAMPSDRIEALRAVDHEHRAKHRQRAGHQAECEQARMPAPRGALARASRRRRRAAAVAGSRRGNAGTQAGGSASTASAALPGQLHSPSVSNQTCVRDVLTDAGIQGFNERSARNPSPARTCPNARKASSGDRPAGRRRSRLGRSRLTLRVAQRVLQTSPCRRSRVPAWSPA